MPETTLTDLPNELLDQVYSYLDWDTSESLVPSRPNIMNISLTSRRLRETIVPIIFRDVTLRLRWVDGALVEPALLKLRRHYPHLVKYVKCVYIDTEFGQLEDPEWKLKAFTVPNDLKQWGDYDSATRQEYSSHQARTADVFRTLFEDEEFTGLFSRIPQQLRQSLDSVVGQLFDQNQQIRQLIGDRDERMDTGGRLGEDSVYDEAPEQAASVTYTPHRKKSRALRLSLESFLVVLLCLPPTIDSIVFESIPTARVDTTQNAFALYVASMAIKVFGDRLRRLTMITHPSAESGRSVVDMGGEAEKYLVSEQVLSNLQSVESLSLSDHNWRHPGTGRTYRSALSEYLNKWHALSSTVVNLELWNMEGAAEELVKHVKGFSRLESLTLNTIVLTSIPGMHIRHDPNQKIWLLFLIEIRRAMVGLAIHLHNLQTRADARALPASGLRWLLEEAVPPGSNVDFERETRLTEDFDSFLFLWSAEDSIRGEQAREERKDGKLVDTAMSNRWLTFENMR